MATLSNPGKTVLRPASLAHVVLKTQASNFEKMVNYYKTFLNADGRFEAGIISFLSYDEEHHRIAIMAIPGTKPKDPESSGLMHIAFTFNSMHDLALSYKQRKANGIGDPHWCVNHGPTTSMYYRDPDGNDLECQVDNFDTMEEACAFMLTEEYAENPVGVDFDPEEFVKRVEAGEDDAVLKKRLRIGPRTAESVKLKA